MKLFFLPLFVYVIVAKNDNNLEPDQIRLPAAGRKPELGKLFDPVTGVVSHYSLGDSPVSTDIIQTRGIDNQKLYYMEQGDLTEYMDSMNLGGDFSIGVLSGAMDVSIRSNYAKSTNYDSSLYQIVLLLLQMTKRKWIDPCQYVNVSSWDGADSESLSRYGSYVIVSVDYGADININILKTITSTSSASEISGSVRFELASFLPMTNVGGGFETASSTSSHHVSEGIKIFADMDVQSKASIFTSIPEFKKFIDTVPNVIASADDGLGLAKFFDAVSLDSLAHKCLSGKKLPLSQRIKKLKQRRQDKLLNVLRAAEKIRSFTNGVYQRAVKSACYSDENLLTINQSIQGVMERVEAVEDSVKHVYISLKKNTNSKHRGSYLAKQRHEEKHFRDITLEEVQEQLKKQSEINQIAAYYKSHKIFCHREQPTRFLHELVNRNKEFFVLFVFTVVPDNRGTLLVFTLKELGKDVRIVLCDVDPTMCPGRAPNSVYRFYNREDSSYEAYLNLKMSLGARKQD